MSGYDLLRFAATALRGHRLRTLLSIAGVSIGVAVFPSRDIKSKDNLIKAADRALYRSKDEGRDRICVFQHQGYIYRPHAHVADDA